MPRPSPSLAALALLAVLAGCGGTASPSPAVPAPASTASPAGSPDSGASLDASATAPASPDASASGGPESTSIEIVGVDYAFENVPASATAGTTLSFTNEGEELHEMIVVRRNDDVDASWEELLAMPEEQALDSVTVAGQAIAEPGQDATETVTVDEAGDYLVACFVPVGMTELPSGSIDPSDLGPPHVTRGMLAELTVEG